MSILNRAKRATISQLRLFEEWETSKDYGQIRLAGMTCLEAAMTELAIGPAKAGSFDGQWFNGL